MGPFCENVGLSDDFVGGPCHLRIRITGKLTGEIGSVSERRCLLSLRTRTEPRVDCLWTGGVGSVDAQNRASRV